MYTEIEYREHDHVGVITIDRPEARNALTFTTYDELADAVATTTRPLPGDHRSRSGVLLRRRRQAGDGRCERGAVEPRPHAATHTGRRRAAAHRRPDHRCGQRRRRRLGHGARAHGRHPDRLRAGHDSASCSSSAGSAATSPAWPDSSSSSAARHAAELLFTGRIIDADRSARELRLGLAGGRRTTNCCRRRLELASDDRCQSAARRAGAQARAARGARPGLGRARPLGQLDARPNCSAPTTTARASRRSSRSGPRTSPVR